MLFILNLEHLKSFNFGADEYANDVFGNPGWSYLQDFRIICDGEFIAGVNEKCKNY